MSNYTGAYDTGAGSPNLQVIQYLQDNWSMDQIQASVQVEKISVTASGTAGVEATGIPVGAEIIDVVVHANATVGGGTARVRIAGGGSNITDAVAMAVTDAVTRCASIDQTFKVVTSTGIEVVTNADTNLGDIYVYYKK